MPAEAAAQQLSPTSDAAVATGAATPGFVRSLRTRVLHAPCGTTTPMKPQQADDMARNPASWSTCWCNVCGRRLDIKQFTWFPDGSPVGS
jgi:hypothetical protein